MVLVTNIHMKSKLVLNFNRAQNVCQLPLWDEVEGPKELCNRRSMITRINGEPGRIAAPTSAIAHFLDNPRPTLPVTKHPVFPSARSEIVWL